jgi:hypothetical protein
MVVALRAEPWIGENLDASGRICIERRKGKDF